MRVYLIKRYQRCARTGCRIYTNDVVEGPRWLASHVTLTCPEQGQGLELIDNYEVLNLRKKFDWSGYE